MKMLLRKTPEGSAALAQRDAALDRMERQILILANGQRSAGELREMMGPSAGALIERLLERRFLVAQEAAPPARPQREASLSVPGPTVAASTLGAAPSSAQFPDTEAAVRALSDAAGPQPTYHAAPTALRVYSAGLTSTEMQLLRAGSALSQRQAVTLTLLDEADATRAEVVVLAGDTATVRERLHLPWMADLPIVWLGGGPAPEGEYVIDRPVPWVRLPTLLAEMLALNPKNTPTTPSDAQRKPRVLVVDDSLAVRRYLASVLTATGADITEADSGEAALVAFKEDKRGFDCVLLDVIMPGIDGYDTCRALKHTYVRQREPAIVMLTSRTSPFDRIRGKFSGCDAYLAKPVDVPKLKATLARFIDIDKTDAHSEGAMRSPMLRPS